MVNGFQVIRDGPREGQLAVGMLTVTNRESLDWFAANLGHQCGDGARVNTSTEKYANWNITHEMRFDRTFEQFAIAANIRLLVERVVR